MDKIVEKPKAPKDFQQALIQKMPALQRRAMYLARHKADAEDLVSTTLTSALENWQQFMPGTNLGAWLNTILFNGFVSGVRRKKIRNEAYSLDDVDIINLLPDHNVADPASALDFDRIMLAIGLMSPEQQKYLWDNVNGVHDEATAARQGIPLGTVKSRIHRIRAELRKQFPEYDAKSELMAKPVPEPKKTNRTGTVQAQFALAKPTISRIPVETTGYKSTRTSPSVFGLFEQTALYRPGNPSNADAKPTEHQKPVIEASNFAHHDLGPPVTTGIFNDLPSNIAGRSLAALPYLRVVLPELLSAYRQSQPAIETIGQLYGALRSQGAAISAIDLLRFLSGRNQILDLANGVEEFNATARALAQVAGLPTETAYRMALTVKNMESRSEEIKTQREACQNHKCQEEALFL